MFMFSSWSLICQQGWEVNLKPKRQVKPIWCTCSISGCVSSIFFFPLACKVCYANLLLCFPFSSPSSPTCSMLSSSCATTAIPLSTMHSISSSSYRPPMLLPLEHCRKAMVTKRSEDKSSSDHFRYNSHPSTPFPTFFS